VSSNTDTLRFLQAVFPDYDKYAVFANLNPAAHTRTVTGLDLTRDCYWSIAAFAPEARTNSSAKHPPLNVRALVVDDVGSKVRCGAVRLGLGEPTAIVETSAGNFQWTYRLATPVPKNDWKAFFAEVERLVGQRLEGRDAAHLFRLPCGVNSKPKRNGFHVKLIQLNPGIELSVAPDFPTLWQPPTASSPGYLALEALAALMRLIPNNLERDGWIEVGHGLKALCADDEDGFTVFDAWSQAHASYDAAKTRTAWDSFGASGLRTQGGLLRARAEALNPTEFRKWEAKVVFDDEEAPPKSDPLGPPEPRKGITATPFKWIDLDKTAPRDWLYGDILLRKFISMTVAPGGVGKSSLVAVETLAQVAGKALLGDEPAGELRVWLWNLEDPYEETQKKLLAAAKHYKIGEAELGDRLFVDSGRDQRLVVAEMAREGPMIVRPVIAALVEQIKLRQIDIVVIDPFVSCHGVPENDNSAMDMVVKEWGRVAEEGNCAVHLVDHTSKAGSQEVVTDSSRGAKAKTDAARVVRVVNRMTATDSKVYGIAEPWRYFNTFNDKANMAPPKSKRDWFRMESLWANNGTGAAAAFSMGAAAAPVRGDSIGVAVQWFPPNAQALANGDGYVAVVNAMGNKRWRAEPRSPDWIGFAIAQGLRLDASSISGRQSVKDALKTWISEGLLKVSAQLDEQRKMRDYIVIAEVC